MIIDKKNIAKYSNLPINYDYSEVMNYVDIAEKIWIVKLIGNPMYNELCEQVAANNVTPVNATLLVEALWPLIGFCIMYEALPSIAYHASEISLTKGSSDNSEPLSLKEIGFYQDHIRRQIEARKDFALEWIKDHIEYYPLIEQCMECDCHIYCCKQGELNKPNPWNQLYRPKKKNTDLK